MTFGVSGAAADPTSSYMKAPPSGVATKTWPSCGLSSLAMESGRYLTVMSPLPRAGMTTSSVQDQKRWPSGLSVETVMTGRHSSSEVLSIWKVCSLVSLTVQPKNSMRFTFSVDGIKCVLDTYHPVPLTVTGRAIKQPTENVKRMEFFGCTVRDTKEQTFQIDNTSDDEWRPVITVTTLKPEGQRFWSCTEDLVIPARGKGDITVKYYPLSMASEDQPHEGQIFVATPDGGAFMYELVGSAAAPDTPNVIQAEVKCKTRHQQAVPIKNWLHARQKFQVKYEMLEPAAGSPEAAVLKIGGADVAGSGTLPDFDLPASLERPYKFAVYAHKAIPSASFRLE